RGGLGVRGGRGGGRGGRVMSSPGTTFGPTALATPANAVTVLRLLVAPLLVALILVVGPSWWAAAAWAVASGTDWVDGWVARRHGVTSSGAFLDPLADKLMVLGALAALVVIGGLWWLPVALIAFREVGMSVYRTLAARRGVSVPARGWAKVKTWAQTLAIALALVPPVAAHGRLAVVAVLWVAVALTLWTGTLYWLGYRRSAVGAAGAGGGAGSGIVPGAGGGSAGEG
ncbi:MAG: CDP-alcohol phosphatidyltransferase family protein, partial [Acidimicrobiales bacterium]